MAKSFFVIAKGCWFSTERNEKRLLQHRCPLGEGVGLVDDKCEVFLKFRDVVEERVRTDPEPVVIQQNDAESFIASSVLSDQLRNSNLGEDQCGIFYFEGTRSAVRCVFVRADTGFFDRIKSANPHLNLDSHDLPPATTCVIDTPTMVQALLAEATKLDTELIAPYATRFFNGPHIMEQLLWHLLELRVEDAPNFVTITKGIADQLRGLLDNHDSGTHILRVDHSHLDAWIACQGQRIKFVDGGAARITAIPGMEPAGLRVGVYSVIPGNTSPTDREDFSMSSQLIADMTESSGNAEHEPDRKRLQEACRYVLELAVSINAAENDASTRALFLHGPLINQFVDYDNLEPYCLPDLDGTFLERIGITKDSITKTVKDIPFGRNGQILWNQFMAVYCYLLSKSLTCKVPLLGVVERSPGHSVTSAVLQSLEDDGVIREAYRKKVERIMEKYRITDTFLFGCLLDRGEYFTPISVNKNNERRAHEEWKAVVRQYARPFSTLIKTEESMPPFRVEMNPSALAEESSMMQLTYHTARLLPKYAFPVGLDIVDKYAKVPDWISRGISAGLASTVMRTALQDGDAKVIAQVRRFLAGEPRDFFYRPSA